MENDRYIDREIAEVFETFRSTFRLAMTASAVITTATITLLGYAITNKSAALLLINAFFPVVLIVFLSYTTRIFMAVALSAITLEKSIPVGGHFASNVMSLILPSMRQYLFEISEIGDLEKRLQKLSDSFWIPFTPFTHLLLPIWSIMQISGAMILWYYYDWPFFPA